MNSWTLQGKRAVVTGAGRGIGAAIVKEFLSLGATVFGVARTTAELDNLKHAHFHYLACDLAQDAERAKVIQQAMSIMDGIDILVNNAGMTFHCSAVDSQPADFDRLMELNAKATFRLGQHAYPFLQKSRGASIVNISSVAGVFGLPNRAFYGASKAAMDHLTVALAVEWGKDGIRVNSVLPWFTQTSMVGKTLADPEMFQRIISATPLGRVAEADDIARAVAFLAMPAASYITGQTLAVDGGYSRQGL
jgi:tropinone reductase I